MDKQSFACRNQEEVQEKCTNSLQQKLQTISAQSTSDDITTVNNFDIAEGIASDTNVKKLELKFSSPDIINITNTGQKDIIFEVDKVKSYQGFHNSRMESSKNRDLETSNYNIVRDCMFTGDTQSADGNRSPSCQIGADKAEKLQAHIKDTAMNGQVTGHHNMCVSQDEQDVESCDVDTDERSGKRVSFLVETAEVDKVNKCDRVVDNCIPTHLSVPSETTLLTKRGIVNTNTKTSSSVLASNDEIHSLSDFCRDVEDSCNEAAFQHVQQQENENRLSMCSNTGNRSASSCSEEASHSGSDFQPIILDVRGGCSEMETEDVNENTNLGASLVTKLSESTARMNKCTLEGNENSVSFPSSSAFHLLQGMINHAASSKHKKKSKTNNVIVKPYSYSGIEILNPVTETVCETNKKYNTLIAGNSLAKSINSSTKPTFSNKTTILSRVPEQPMCDSSLRVASTSSKVSLAAICPVTSDSQLKKPSQALSNVLISSGSGTTAYSCVFVEGNSNIKKKLALLIPQSVSGFSNISSSISSWPSKTSVNENQKMFVKTNNSGQICTTSSGTEHHGNSHISIMESVSKMVTNTVKNFSIEGKDIRDSSLLKVSASKRSECSEYAVNCPICGEGFCDEYGLSFHLNRTVFHLYFHCRHCEKKNVFYNKCTLWMHIRTETDEPLLNYNDILYLKPYEFSADDGDDTDTLETIDTSDSASEKSAYSPNVTDLPNDRCVSLSTSPVEEVIAAKPVDNCLVAMPFESSSSIAQSCDLSKCSICFQEFENLTAHLCYTTSKKYSCPSCGMFLPSTCARDAHVKIHDGVAKVMSCPECGEKDFKMTNENDDLRFVFDHVDSCKHFNRILDIKCFCNQELTTVNHLLKHFVDKHCRTLFKCTSCVLAFTQYDHLVGHMDKIHNMRGTSIGFSVICLFCQLIIKSATELKDHVDQHVEDLKNNSVFKWKCFICSKSFVEKSDLNKHLEADHPHKSKRCTVCFSLFWSRKNLVEHIVQKKCLRLMSLKLNCCVDQHPAVPEPEVERVDFSKLFESKKVAPEVGGDLARVGTVPLRNKRNYPINILPKSASNQSITTEQSSKQKQQISENFTPAQPVTLQTQVLTEVSPTCNSTTNSSLTPQACKIIITGKHTNAHGKDKSVSAYVNQCVVCKKLIESSKLTDHLKFHQSQNVIICFLCQRRDFATMDEALEHSDTCGHKDLGGTKHQKGLGYQSSVDKNISTEVCGDVDSALELHEQANTKSVESHSVFPCLLCGFAFQSLSSREEHVSRMHDGTRIVYHCGICRKRGKANIFIKRELASRHITKKHRIVNMDTVNRLIRTEEQNVSSGEKLPVSKPAPDEADGASAPKRLRVAGEGDYLCGKCGFSCSRSEEFSQHIASHNSAQEPQCPECGLCFTIFHALKKHLFAVHKIKAVDDYLKAKDIVEPELEEEEMDSLPEIHPFRKPRTVSRDLNSDKCNTSIKISSPPNPLECTVCYKVFDNEANLKTHMRNHGMAFIRSKRYKL